MADNKGKGIPGIPAVAAPPIAAPSQAPKTEAELMQEMQAAVKTNDYKAVAKAAQEMVKFQKAREQSELEAKQKILATKTAVVQLAITKALQPLIDREELDLADGIWFTQDFGEKLVTCRLIKATTRTAGKGGGTGGGGKKFSVGTSELLTKHGSAEYKDGASFQSAWDSNTDKNWRYAIREALLKKDGIIS